MYKSCISFVHVAELFFSYIFATFKKDFVKLNPQYEEDILLLVPYKKAYNLNNDNFYNARLYDAFLERAIDTQVSRLDMLHKLMVQLNIGKSHKHEKNSNVRRAQSIGEYLISANKGYDKEIELYTFYTASLILLSLSIGYCQYKLQNKILTLFSGFDLKLYSYSKDIMIKSKALEVLLKLAPIKMMQSALNLSYKFCSRILTDRMLKCAMNVQQKGQDFDAKDSYKALRTLHKLQNKKYLFIYQSIPHFMDIVWTAFDGVKLLRMKLAEPGVIRRSTYKTSVVICLLGTMVILLKKFTIDPMISNQIYRYHFDEFLRKMDVDDFQKIQNVEKLKRENGMKLYTYIAVNTLWGFIFSTALFGIKISARSDPDAIIELTSAFMDKLHDRSDYINKNTQRAHWVAMEMLVNNVEYKTKKYEENSMNAIQQLL